MADRAKKISELSAATSAGNTDLLIIVTGANTATPVTKKITWQNAAISASGYSGYSGISGFSGYSGISGFSGYSGVIPQQPMIANATIDLTSVTTQFNTLLESLKTMGLIANT